MDELQVTRKTASKYLEMLVAKGFMQKQKIGKTNFNINEPLYQLFKENKINKQKVDSVKTFNPLHD